MVQQTVIDQQQLSSSFGSTTHELLQLLTSFDQQQINTVPYAGSWTAAQVGEHLFKSDSAILHALYGPVKETERAADKYVADINGQFLDFSTKMSAPDIIIPEKINHDKDMLIVALKGTRDLSPTCTDPTMSTIVGHWTRLEYVNFVISHTKRHINQLKKIHNSVAK